MKILILSSEFPPAPGGIGTHAYHLALELSRLGWDVRVVTRQDYASRDEVRAYNRQLPFKVFMLRSVPTPPGEVLYRMSVVGFQIATWRPDVILSSGGRMVWLASWLSRFHRRPWAAVGHGTEFGAKQKWQKRFTVAAFNRADIVICVSEYTRSQMFQLGVHPRRDAVISNGADPSFYRPLPTVVVDNFRALKGFNNRRIILTVGNVTARKGQEVVIRALPRILKAVPDVHYVIVGLPTLENSYRNLAGELGVGDHVHFLGRVEAEVSLLWMNICDLFVMTSRHTTDGDFEGYGIAVVEAALCGKAAVVSDNSGLGEAIENGVTGLSACENDSEDTARVIIEMLGNESRLQSMSDAARDRAFKSQTWSQRAMAYDQILCSIARGRE